LLILGIGLERILKHVELGSGVVVADPGEGGQTVLVEPVEVVDRVHVAFAHVGGVCSVVLLHLTLSGLLDKSQRRVKFSYISLPGPSSIY
jgi:hypothetical protein